MPTLSYAKMLIKYVDDVKSNPKRFLVKKIIKIIMKLLKIAFIMTIFLCSAFVYVNINLLLHFNCDINDKLINLGLNKFYHLKIVKASSQVSTEILDQFIQEYHKDYVNKEFFDKKILSQINDLVQKLVESEDRRPAYVLFLIKHMRWPEQITLLEYNRNYCVFLYEIEKQKYILVRSLLPKLTDLTMGEFLKLFEHDNIYKTIATTTEVLKYNSDSMNRKEVEVCWILQEYCEKVSCEFFYKNEERIRIIAMQLLNAIEYLHSLKFIHGKIYLDNLIFVKNENGEISYKLKVLYYNKENIGFNYYNLNEFEMIKNYGGIYCDIWSLGSVIYSLYYQTKIFRVYSTENKSLKIIFDSNISAELKDFIERCQRTCYEENATISELKRHPFICGSNFSV